MDKIVEFCKSYDVEFSMHWINDYDGFVLKMTRIEDGIKHVFVITTTDDDINTMIDIFVDRAAEEFDIEKNIEVILKRADVIWRDETNLSGFPLHTRIITSQNTHAPLTEFEKGMIRRMFKNRGYIGHISFGVLGGK